MRLILAVLCLQTCLSGQKILYSSDQDKVGQQATAAAKKIMSDTLASEELQNLATIEKQQVDGELDTAVITMRREIEALSTWQTIKDLSARIRRAIDDPVLGVGPIDTTSLDTRKAEIQQETAALKAKASQVKAANKQPFSLSPVIDRLGDAKDVMDFVGQISPTNPEASKALQQAIDGLKEVNELLDTAHNIWQSAKDVSVNPGTLAPSPEDTQLALLSVETQYLKELALIRARRMLDYGELRSILDELDRSIESARLTPAQQIRADIAALVADARAAGPASPRHEDDRIAVKNRLTILFLAASVSAQNIAARDIAGLRETLAWRRSKLRTDALYNGTYERTIQIASERLAAYYSAGVKPSQIAQVLFDLVGVVSLPKIAF